MNRVREIGPILRQRHAGMVRKLCFSIGASCPNRDGTSGVGGCSFCAEERSTEPLDQQLQRQLRDLPPQTSFIAYLQDHSATHLSPRRLEQVLGTIRAAHPFVGLTLGTRPDCLDDEVLAVLERHDATGPPLLVELGLQSACDATLELINRCHDVACFRTAVAALHQRRIAVCAHVILGLPTPGSAPGEIAVEGVDHALASAALLDEVGIEAVKVHNCHVLRGTALAELHAAGRYTPPSLEGYIELLIAFLERLPAEVELHRLVGEARPPRLVAPAFSAHKASALRQIRAVLEERDCWQGRAR
jgi:radical SAM protein (TIGR01212 family)